MAKRVGSYPKRQYVVAVKRGRRINYFYGDKLGDLVRMRVPVGGQFTYALLTTGDWADGYRNTEQTYSTKKEK